MLLIKDEEWMLMTEREADLFWGTLRPILEPLYLLQADEEWAYLYDLVEEDKVIGFIDNKYGEDQVDISRTDEGFSCIMWEGDDYLGEVKIDFSGNTTTIICE